MLNGSTMIYDISPLIPVARIKRARTQFKVETAVPIPGIGGAAGAHRRTKYPFRKMKIGDSFFVAVTDDRRAVLQSNLIGSAKFQTDGRIRITTRSVAGGVRVWRVA